MTDSLDTSATPPTERNRDQRAWIHLYYKLLLQTRRQDPSFPVCTSDTVAAVALQSFFRSPEEAGGIKPHSVKDDEIYKATFIRYRNAALPNLLSHIVQLCKETTESDSRVSVPQVFVTRPMLNEYIRVSEKYSLDNDDPEPWERQTELWEFISATVAERFLHRGVLDSQDTVVQSFVRVAEDESATDQADTRMARPFIPSTDLVSEEPQPDHPKVPTPTTKQDGKRAKQNAKKKANKKAKTWLPVERHALWRSINAWCHEHGIDAFDHENIELQTWDGFTEEINAECAQKGQVKERTGDHVRSQVRDAVRRGNFPISDLVKRAKEMREEIKKGKTKTFSRNERYPENAIEIP
ncbi:hypothetical protein J4E91_008935 [Alternaria rosae]|nr:hypothetical protein J4E91_008935 [Alternaria rosae]